MRVPVLGLSLARVAMLVDCGIPKYVDEYKKGSQVSGDDVSAYTGGFPGDKFKGLQNSVD